MKTVVGQAKTLSDDLKDHRKAHRLISEMIDKVIIHQDALELRLPRERLAEILGTQTGSEDPILECLAVARVNPRKQDLAYFRSS